MTVRKHGISIGMDRNGERVFLSLKAVGKLNHQDYVTITPFIEGALKSVSSPHVRAIFDMTEFEGWELRAAWDDLKLGLKHGSEFEKIALVGHKDWQATAAKVGNWFVSGEIQFFHDYDEALRWLSE